MFDLRWIEQAMRKRVRLQRWRRIVARHSDSYRIPVFAIRPSGGMGDLIVIARFWRDFLASLGGEVRFFVFYQSEATGNLAFANIPGFIATVGANKYSSAMRAFDCAFTINQFVGLDHRAAAISSLSSAAHQRIDEMLARMNELDRELGIFRGSHPRLDGYLGHYAKYKQRRRFDFLHYLAGIAYGGHHINLEISKDLARFDLPTTYITLHNGFDDAMSSSGTATKVFPRWREVIAVLRASDPFPIKIVQIGSESSSSAIEGVDISLVGKTTLAEAVAIVSGGLFHLDNEGGLVHAAISVGRESCVIFGPTSVEYFGYPENVNVAPAECGGCWWVETSWMKKCPRAADDVVPLCMRSHDATFIASAVAALVKNHQMNCHSGSSGQYSQP